MMNIENALKDGIQILKKSGIKSSILDSELLMSKVLKKSRKFILLNLKKDIQIDLLDNFKKLINDRSLNKPISYLTKKKYFWNHEFEINEYVLIPRSDTEVLVEETFKLSKNKKRLKILEIGVGSGCILLSILHEKKDFYGVGIDISKNCIDISKKNSSNLGVGDRVKFFKSDVDNFNYGKYDLLISNPPYINQFDLKYLEKDVINFEPKLALDGGIDGLSEIRKVINKSSELIKIRGKLILEIGFDQKHKVKKILRNKGFYINKIVKDYANNDRCIISTKL